MGGYNIVAGTTSYDGLDPSENSTLYQNKEGWVDSNISTFEIT